MHRALLAVVGVVMAVGAVGGFVARQERGAGGVGVLRPGLEQATEPRTRNLRTVAPPGDARASRAAETRAPDTRASETRATEARRADRDPRGSGRVPGGWRALQLVLDAVNAFVGIVGIGLAFMGMRGGRDGMRGGMRDGRGAQRAASHTPDRISPSPSA